MEHSWRGAPLRAEGVVNIRMVWRLTRRSALRVWCLEGLEFGISDEWKAYNLKNMASVKSANYEIDIWCLELFVFE